MKKELKKAAREETAGFDDPTYWLFDPLEAREELMRIKNAEIALSREAQYLHVRHN